MHPNTEIKAKFSLQWQRHSFLNGPNRYGETKRARSSSYKKVQEGYGCYINTSDRLKKKSERIEKLFQLNVNAGGRTNCINYKFRLYI